MGEYDKGWDIVRQQRLKKQKELGIIPENTQLAERMWYVPDYSLLAPAARAVVGKKMELYAGLVENLDHHIGRLVDHLKKIGRTWVVAPLEEKSTTGHSLTIHKPLRVNRMENGFYGVSGSPADCVYIGIREVMKEMPITLMTRPFGKETLSIRIFELTSEGEWERAALPAIFLVIIGLIPTILLFIQSEKKYAK